MGRRPSESSLRDRPKLRQTTYLNNELMKRYVLFRKMVNQQQFILYAEIEEVEKVFRDQSPAKILSRSK